MGKDLKITTAQKIIIKAYCSLSKKLQNYPTRNQMKEIGYSKDKIEYHFGNLFTLKQKAKEFCPDAFNKIIDDSQFNPKKLEELNSEVSKYSKFIITTAVTGCDIHQGFYKTLQNYCKANNACLLIIPCSEPTKIKTINKWDLDPYLVDHNIVFSDVVLNSNVYISTIKTQAKQLLPLTGLNRLTSEFGSCIIASPKQQLKMIPSSDTKLPKALLTTGALTEADYTPEKYLSERLAALGKKDHILGAIVIEVEDDQFFHFRHLQADRQGHFYDLDKFYTESKIESSTIEYFIPGDWHCGETDPKVYKTWLEITKALKPKKLVLHDVASFSSICHFDIGNSLTLAQKANQNKLCLEAELALIANDLNHLSSSYEEIIIVKSNHDQRLERYLESGRYIDEPQNLKIALKLASAQLEGHYALQWAMENYFKIHNPEKIRWLKRDDDYRFKGIQLAYHGDYGCNGAKATPSSLEAVCPNAVIGHFHSPQIIRNLWVVGTSTYLKLDYNGKGPSSWSHASVIIHKNGQKQMIHSILGKWHV